MKLIRRLKNPKFIEKLNEYNEMNGYTSPEGKITYNKIVDKRSFAIFTDIISDIVPIDIVNNDDINNKLPSIARVLKPEYKHVYPEYLYLNATMEEYLDYEDEQDNENMNKLLDKIPLKSSLIGITIQKNEVMKSAHASAFIAWRCSPKKFKFAYYDPLAYQRKDFSYDYIQRAFVEKRFEKNIEFIDLTKYCFRKTPQELHCPQYVMNAEYCYLYSLYFLHKWIEFGAKLHRASFRKAITASFIVKPNLLTRVNNKDSMIYRVVMMAFICKYLLKYLRSLSKTVKQKYITNSDKNIQDITDYLNGFKSRYGFRLTFTN